MIASSQSSHLLRFSSIQRAFILFGLCISVPLSFQNKVNLHITIFMADALKQTNHLSYIYCFVVTPSFNNQIKLQNIILFVYELNWIWISRSFTTFRLYFLFIEREIKMKNVYHRTTIISQKSTLREEGITFFYTFSFLLHAHHLHTKKNLFLLVFGAMIFDFKFFKKKKKFWIIFPSNSFHLLIIDDRRRHTRERKNDERKKDRHEVRFLLSF